MTSSRFVEVGIESSFGGGSAGLAGIRCNAVTPAIDRGIIYEESIEDYNVIGAYGGPLKLSGSLDGNVRPKQMATMIQSLMGTKTTVTGPPAHDDYTFGSPASVELRVGEETAGGQFEQSFVGVGIKEISLNAEAKDFLKFAAPFIAKDITTPSYGVPSYTSEKPTVFWGVAVKVGGASVATAKSIEVKLGGALNEDEFVLNSFKLNSLKRNGHVEVTGTLGFTEDELTELKKAMYGSSSNTSIPATNDIANVNLEMVCTDPDGNNSMELEMPTTIYASTERKVSGRDIIDKTIDFRAIGSAVKWIVYT